MDWSLEKIGLTIEIVKNLYDLTGQWVGNLINLDTNMETLKRKTEQLKGREKDINEDVNYKVLRSRKRRRAVVELWQEDVRRIANDVQTLERQVQEVSWMNVYKRAKLGNRVVETIQEVGKQYENGEFSNRLLLDDPTCGRAILTAESLAETTSVRNKEKIWNFLMDDAVRKIGVWGMGGVGKTTIMKHINNQLLVETRNFSDVVWVTVRKTLEIKNLQRQIAKKLNLNLSDNKDELRTASEIHNMLSQKKRYVIILDDLWKAFPLEEVGIPEPTRDNGCKLVLTTRLLEVSRQMECINVEVERLTEDETLNLFMRNVKEHQTVLDPQVKETAGRIAKKCARLPLVIVTVARSMKGVNEIHEWKNAEQIMDKEKGIFKRLKFSYSRLKDEQAQHCFLYCALYPEDYNIQREELIEYWIAEGLIREMGNREAMFSKGQAILNKLINTYLLEKGVLKESVKMHDLMRDMALKITSTSPRFMVRAGEGLKRVPHKDWSKDLERVSLMHNDIEELPSEPICPRLTTFLGLGSLSKVLPNIPDSFFLRMRGLKVLDLSYTAIESLPKSISKLENLHQLLLRNCHKLEYVPSLERLKALEHFELTYSQIVEVPQGIGELVNLRKLVLCGNCNIKYVPSLERLKALEHFELTYSQIEVPQGIGELVNLRKLVLCKNYNIKYVPSLERLKALEHFALTGSQIKEVPQGIEELVNLRKLELSDNDILGVSPNIPDSFFLRMRGLKVLDLSNTAIESLPKSISKLENLHHLLLRDCPRLEYVPSLEKLKALEHFELTYSLIEEVPQGIGELVNLRKLVLCGNCNIKYVPSLERLKALEHFALTGSQIKEVPQGIEELVNLRKLELSDNYILGMSPCWKLCRLTQLHYLEIRFTEVKVSAEELFCLKQLKFLSAQFHNEQELTKFVNSEQCKSLEQYGLTVRIVDESNFCTKERTLFCVYDWGDLYSNGVDAVVPPSDIRYLKIRSWDNHISLSDIQSLRNARGLREFVIHECRGLQSVFSSSSPSSSSSSSCFSEDYHIPLTTIEILRFRKLPNFRVLFDRVVPPHYISFNLKTLVFWYCPKIVNIFSALLLHNFPNLEALDVLHCENVEEIIVEVETSDRGGHREDDGNTITLPNLEFLRLVNLPKLKSINKGIMVCESLKSIAIGGCPMLRRLPISLHMNEDGEQASAPPALESITGEEEWWEFLEWDNPLTKTILQPLFDDGYPDGRDDFEEFDVLDLEVEEEEEY